MTEREAAVAFARAFRATYTPSPGGEAAVAFARAFRAVCRFIPKASAVPKKRQLAPSVQKKRGRPPKVTHMPGENLLLGSNPQPSLPLFDDTVDGKRKLHCRRYGNCLEYAMKMDWESFDCLDCKVESMITKRAWENDLEGLAMLLRAIAD
jgi:hypothetical protein